MRLKLLLVKGVLELWKQQRETENSNTTFKREAMCKSELLNLTP